MTAILLALYLFLLICVCTYILYRFSGPEEDEEDKEELPFCPPQS